MTIQEIHNFVDFYTRKERKGYFAREEIDLALNSAQLSFISELLNSKRTHKFYDSLARVKKTIRFNANNYSSSNVFGTGPTGTLFLPEDYLDIEAITPYSTSSILFTAFGGYVGPGSQDYPTEFQTGDVYVVQITTGGEVGNIEVKYDGEVVFPNQTVSNSASFTFAASASDKVLTLTTDIAVYDINGFTPVNMTVNKINYLSPLPLELLGDDQAKDRLLSKLMPPSAAEPICVPRGISYEGDAHIKFFPEQGFAGWLTYIKRPTVPLFAYTTSGRTITYDPVNSVQMEWDDRALQHILILALRILGINNNDIQMVQHTDQRNIIENVNVDK